MTRLEIVALEGVPEVAEGADLGALLLAACATTGVTLRDGDVVCVAQKVVSKAEGRLRRLPAGTDPQAARRQVARDEAVRVVVDSPAVLVVETRHGFVCANAGVDASNLPHGTVALLPVDPDASAAALRGAVRDAAGVDVGVIVTDTFGRPWREGQTDVAIGCAGISPLRDERGTTDRDGNVLEVTVVAVADEVASAADLARPGKADGAPFVVVRGARVTGGGSARDLVRPAEQDLFRFGGADPVVQALRLPPSPRRFAARSVPDEVVALAVETGRVAADPAPAIDRLGDGPGGLAGEVEDAVGTAPLLLRVAPARPGVAAHAAAGACVHAVRVVLAAHGVASVWVVTPDADGALGVVAAGYPGPGG